MNICLKLNVLSYTYITQTLPQQKQYKQCVLDKLGERWTFDIMQLGERFVARIDPTLFLLYIFWLAATITTKFYF